MNFAIFMTGGGLEFVADAGVNRIQGAGQIEIDVVEGMEYGGCAEVEAAGACGRAIAVLSRALLVVTVARSVRNTLIDFAIPDERNHAEPVVDWQLITYMDGGSLVVFIGVGGLGRGVLGAVNKEIEIEAPESKVDAEAAQLNRFSDTDDTALDTDRARVLILLPRTGEKTLRPCPDRSHGPQQETQQKNPSHILNIEKFTTFCKYMKLSSISKLGM